jgi:hypothetical protein
MRRVIRYIKSRYLFSAEWCSTGPDRKEFCSHIGVADRVDFPYGVRSCERWCVTIKSTLNNRRSFYWRVFKVETALLELGSIDRGPEFDFEV